MSIPERIGRYSVAAELGRGAMGVVYRGLDPSLDRQVAIKVISPAVTTGSLSVDELEARFLREARVAARINHPNVVHVYDAGRDGHFLYLVMELIEGESLSARLARKEYPETRQALELAAQVADALGAAHALGVIHRDVKPANVMLTRQAVVKVADFGVAKAVGEDTGLTRTGTVVGSPAYMAPEQVRGETIDGRADLFSLGVVLYELLLKRRPFPSDTVTTLIYQILHADPLADPEISRSLDPGVNEFLRRCLAKNAADRVPDAAAFARHAREVAHAIGAGSVVKTAPAVIQSAPRPTATSATVINTATTPPPPPVPPTSTAPTSIGPPVPPTPPSVEATAPTAVVKAAMATGATVVDAAPATPPAAPAHGTGTPAPPVVPPSRPVPTQPPGGDGPKPGRRRNEVAFVAVGLVLLAVAALIVALRGCRPAGTVIPTASPTPLPAATVTDALPTTVPPTPTSTATAVPSPTPQPLAIPVSPVPTEIPSPVPTATPTPPIVATFQGRKGAKFGVDPEETLVYIDGKLLGKADDWDDAGGGKKWLASPGTYYARFVLEGYKSVWVKIVVREGAEDEIASVDTELQKAK